MPSTYTPFGLRPLYHPSGIIRPTAGTIASAYGSNIYQGAPVQIAADGTLTLAAAGARAMGCFCGVEFTPNDGRRRVSNFWPASQVASDIVAYYTRDPEIIYEVQANATLAITTVGSQYDWTTNDTSAGNTTTGLSTVGLNTGAGAANAGLQVLGIGNRVDNAWGDAFPVVQVRISEHQLVADVAQF